MRNSKAPRIDRGILKKFELEKKNVEKLKILSENVSVDNAKKNKNDVVYFRRPRG